VQRAGVANMVKSLEGFSNSALLIHNLNMPMWFTRRCLQQPPHICSLRLTRNQRAFSNGKHETDAYGIPVRPTWSVNELLSSYPTPTLSSATLTRLHELSALIPPDEGTPEHATLKQEMEDLIRLVEAVKLVDTKNVQPRVQHGVENLGEKTPDLLMVDSLKVEASGQSLLRHAARTSDGFYTVDADKKR
jgi:Asp-tRNA(Asn)/Glu-tRNA(Gln) amidotransferase C subunit